MFISAFRFCVPCTERHNYISARKSEIVHSLQVYIPLIVPMWSMVAMEGVRGVRPTSLPHESSTAQTGLGAEAVDCDPKYPEYQIER